MYQSSAPAGCMEAPEQERLIDHTSSIPLAVDGCGNVVELRGYTPDMSLGSYYTWRNHVDMGGWPD